MSTEERVVEVMGTTAHVIVTGDADAADAADAAVARLHELEARWSRFRPDSELSRLNRMPGVPVIVSAETYSLIEHALAAVAITDGRFDPTLLPELRDAGYDRSFELIARADEDDAPTTPTEPSEPGAPMTRAHPAPADVVHLGPIVRSVTLEPGTELDPGGIGKGLAADLVVDELLARGVAGALVNVGGDLYAAGDAPEHEGWVVAVADPYHPSTVVATLALASGAVASTWRTKRAWIGGGGEPRHHLIDPRTGISASTGLAGVTVVGGRGWHAEVLAKAAFLAGPDLAEDVLTRNDAAGILFLDDGSARDVADVARYRA
jgi:thiamine biosynthesis lipoprotein